MQSGDTKSAQTLQTVTPQVAQGGSMTSVGQISLPIEIQEAGRAGKPHIVNKHLLAALPSTVKSSLKWKISNEGEKTGVCLVTKRSHSESDLKQALAIVSETCKPSDPSFIALQLAKCDAACKSRAEDFSDTKARAAVFADGLREFPVDCVADAFKSWMRSEKFTPALSDIRENCWREYRARFGLLNMLKKMIDENDKPTEQKRERVTPDQMKAIRDKINASNIVNGQ